MLQLRPKISRIHVRRQVARPTINPSVLVYLTPKKALTISPFFANNFSTIAVTRVVNRKRATFAHRIVLSFMKAIATKMTNSAESLTLIRTQNTLCRIFNDQQVVACSDVHDSIHITCNASIMHRNDNLGFISYRPLNGIGINIHCVRAHVNKHQSGADHLKCRSSRRESEARQNHLITRM